MEGNYNRIMDAAYTAVYGTLWTETGLILDMEFADHGKRYGSKSQNQM